MKTIAIEEHLLTPNVREAWTAAASSAGDAAETSLNHGDMQQRLEDLADARLARMDENGVDVQVLSLTSPGLHNLAPTLAVALARETNDLIAASIALHPDRFDGFATLSTTAPEDAVRELERCVHDLGFKAGMLFGRTGEKNLDHPDFWPIFEAASSLQIPLFIHPQIAPRAVRQAYYSGFDPQVDLAFATFGLGWHYDCGVQFLRLALAGVFDRFPQLQIILGHWGEVVLFYAERLKGFSRVIQLQRPILEVMRQNLYVTSSGMFSESYFRHALEVVSMDRILFSTDYPYQYRPGRGPAEFLEQLSLPEEDKAKIAHGNWERLTGNIER